jgi:hypothetical protein
MEMDGGNYVDQIGEVLGYFGGLVSLLSLVSLVIILVILTAIVGNVVLLLGTGRQALGFHQDLNKERGLC